MFEVKIRREGSKCVVEIWELWGDEERNHWMADGWRVGEKAFVGTREGWKKAFGQVRKAARKKMKAAA